MSYMFAYCGLDGFPYSNNANTDKAHTNVIALDVSSFDTSNVTNMDHMFYICNTESELAVSGWDVSKVTNMSFMFAGDWISNGGKHYFTHLTVDSVDNWNTSSCTNFRGTFDFCSRITELELDGDGTVGSGWDFSKATTVNRMFDCCINLETMVLPKRTVLDSLVEDPALNKDDPNGGMCYMLSECVKLDIDDFADILSRMDMAVLGNNGGQRRTFCTYGHTTPNIYLGGKGDSTVERTTDYARLVYIPKARYETAPVGDDYKFITFTAQYNCYDFFDAKVSTESKTFRGSGNEKYTGDPSSDGDITITSGRWAKDGDANSYEDVKNPKTVTITNGEFTFGDKTMIRQ